ncbi:MAG TPA: hypothetical protein VHI53_05585 [Gaiellaceae bacterium]|jgi:hypothetical protein|nr:hypothetical protein [Gaiellaceae bacterium]
MVAVGAVLAVAFSITQDAVMTIWNVALGIVVMLWAFGFGTMKELLSSNRRKAEVPTSGASYSQE